MSAYSKYDKDLEPLMSDSRIEMDKVGNLIRFRLKGDKTVYEFYEPELMSYDGVWNLVQRFGNSWVSSPFLFDVLTGVVKKQEKK